MLSFVVVVTHNPEVPGIYQRTGFPRLKDVSFPEAVTGDIRQSDRL